MGATSAAVPAVQEERAEETINFLFLLKLSNRISGLASPAGRVTAVAVIPVKGNLGACLWFASFFSPSVGDRYTGFGLVCTENPTQFLAEEHDTTKSECKEMRGQSKSDFFCDLLEMTGQGRSPNSM